MTDWVHQEGRDQPLFLKGSGGIFHGMPDIIVTVA
jgi:hypothetical protein